VDHPTGEAANAVSFCNLGGKSGVMCMGSRDAEIAPSVNFVSDRLVHVKLFSSYRKKAPSDSMQSKSHEAVDFDLTPPWGPNPIMAISAQIHAHHGSKPQCLTRSAVCVLFIPPQKPTPHTPVLTATWWLLSTGSKPQTCAQLGQTLYTQCHASHVA
jgi:hypothetical protein